MIRKKHTRKVNRIIMFTTDAVDADTRTLKLHPALLWTVIFILSILIGGAIGYGVFESQLWKEAGIRSEEKDNVLTAKDEEIANLNVEIATLNQEIETLNHKIELLGAAVNANAETAEALQTELDLQSIPSDYPLTGNAGISVADSENPLIVFSAAEGTMVVTAGKGTVREVSEDAEYGNCVVVDHGNGYVSIYRNQGDVQVKVGDEVTAGTTVYLITADNKEVGYQIIFEDVYVDPLDVMTISG